jgi:hypothetical protein
VILKKYFRAEAKLFTMTFGNNEDECFDWEILGNKEYHIDYNFTPPDDFKVMLSCFNFENSIQGNFLDIFFLLSKVMLKLLTNLG